MTKYAIECDTCGEEIVAEVNGYIAEFGEAWCESCGNLGRKKRNRKKSSLSLGEVTRISNAMPEDNPFKHSLSFVIKFGLNRPEHLGLCLITANQIIRAAELGGGEE